MGLAKRRDSGISTHNSTSHAIGLCGYETPGYGSLIIWELILMIGTLSPRSFLVVIEARPLFWSFSLDEPIVENPFIR